MTNSLPKKPMNPRAPVRVAGDHRWAAAAEHSSSKAHVPLRETIYHALFEASAIPSFLLSPEAPDFIFVAANDAYLSATGKTRADLIGRKVFDVFTDDPSRPGENGQALFRSSLARVLETRQPNSMPLTRYDIPDAKGGFEERWWLATSAPVLNASGRVEVILHQVTDITEQHFAQLAEQKHQAREAFLLKLSDAQRPLADANAIKVTAMRLLGEHLKANRALYAEVAQDDWLIDGGYVQGVEPLPEGRSPMDQYGLWIIDLFRAGRRLVIQDVRTDTRFEPSQREAHEAIQIIGAAAVPLIKNGTLVAILVVQIAAPRDWSDLELELIEEVAERTWAAVERARSEAAALQSRQALEQSRTYLADALRQAEVARDQSEAAGGAKDRFLAILSHELRTPLTPVLLAMELVARDQSLPSPVRNAVEIVRRNVRLEVQLIDDLLDVTRISTGKMDLTLASTTLRAIIDVAVEVSTADLKAKGQLLTVELEAGHDELLADVKRLQQVFWNLLKNASKFTPPGGEIRIRSRLSDRASVEVQVQDSGIGFEADAAHRIFHAFEQGSDRVRREHGGLGLGLAIARASVEAHGGSIRAESAGIGSGATFTVDLPFAGPKEGV